MPCILSILTHLRGCAKIYHFDTVIFGFNGMGCTCANALAVKDEGKYGDGARGRGR